jgi:16S rRNA C967 or C1407 C5-methylase (RsmB/RsmF family)
MAASAPLLAPAATARVSRPRPHRRVRSHRAGPSRIRATEPNQVPDVGATQREIERLEQATHRDAPDEDTPALAKKTKPPADPVRWPLVHARAVEALAHILANPGTDAQKVMRKALRAQYRPRKSLVYDGSSSDRWPGAEPPTNTERGAIADAVLASEVNRIRLAYLAHQAAMTDMTVPGFGRAALWSALCDQEIADECDDDMRPDTLSYLDAADAMIAVYWAGLGDDGEGAVRDECFAASKLTSIKDKIIDPASIDWPTDPSTRLAAKRSIPVWLASKLIDQHGTEVADAIARALLRKAPMFARLNRAKEERLTNLRGRLQREGVESMDMTEWQVNLRETAEADGTPPCDVIKTPVDGAKDALVFPKNWSPFRLDVWRDGWFEIQDAGSQAVARVAVEAAGEASASTWSCGPRRRECVVLDMCAGNGGKTLAMASELHRRRSVGEVEEYAIDVFDVDARRLRHLESNAERAGVTGDVRVISFDEMRDAARVGNGEKPPSLVDVGGTEKENKQDPRYDLVLCDVPCSSTGALRRTPSMRWLIDGESIGEWREQHEEAHLRDPLRFSTEWGGGDDTDGIFAPVDADDETDGVDSDGSRGTSTNLSLPEIQRRILAKAAGLVRPGGGALVYATCSLLHSENEAVRRWFDDKFGDEFAPLPFKAHWPLAPTMTGDVESEDWRNGVENGVVTSMSHDFALRPDLHGCDGFYIARWVRKLT